jgi:hypothetical protein
MNRIAAFATVTVLAAAAGSGAVAAHAGTAKAPVSHHVTSSGDDSARSSFIRSKGHVVLVSSADDHRQRTRHAEPGDDKGGVARHAEPGDDRGGVARHAEPGDDHGRHGGHGSDD